MKIRAGQNITVTEDGEDVFINAPVINKTVMKHGPFMISGDSVEILAGEHIEISSAHPDKLTIKVNIDREKARIADLEKRVENFEKVVASLLRKKYVD